MTTTTAEVYLDNDHEFRYRLTRAATTTGATEAAASLGSVTAHFSETDGGAAIATTSTALTERSAKPGSYFGILDKTTLNTALSAYANRKLFEVFVVAGDAETSEPVIVKATRRPG
jgi:hypothetical protein